MLKDLIVSLRPQQWVKNLLVFAALIFAKELGNSQAVLKSVLAFVCFCLLSSSVYLVNDLIDASSDRQHPLKSKRPIASGRVSTGTAVILASALVVMALAGAFWIGTKFGLAAVAYLGLSTLYTFALKHTVILDVMTVSLGFVLRAVAGALAIEVEISSWLLVCTVLLALFLSLGKRRHELVLLEGEATSHRKILTEYSPYFLDQMIAVVTASTLVAYCFYTLSPEIEHKFGTKYLSLTIPFVLYGIFRYLYLIHQKEAGGNPTQMLLTDKPILLNIILWIVTVLVILYLG
ncbi:MAG: phosphoribose diphosphate--decaprenyl-phosphate phosphoribosyltransferase [candidate division Zixibacteria bacterium RBG_16_50_21]|nr:MAG: phosphoribose diphosphate--decaprenyl-phosphate phosphoribosyltransferase [candidate division Zixibacteria bacterium RBG_16_50_21]